jgi:GNAT superfamily N-acetyltransferase
MPYASVRRVLPHEYSKYRAHLKSLDQESRTFRFSAPVSDTAIDNLCDKFEADSDKHILFAIENRKLEFIAVGHISLDGEMELAFSVIKRHQGRGFGTLLMQRCIQWCRTHGVLKGCMICLSSNATIRHLCRKHGIAVENDHGESMADIVLPPAGMDTFISETIDNNLSTIDYFAKRAKNNLLFLSN